MGVERVLVYEAGPDVAVGGERYVVDDRVGGIGGGGGGGGSGSGGVGSGSGGDLAFQARNGSECEDDELSDTAIHDNGFAGMAAPLTSRITC